MANVKSGAFREIIIDRCLQSRRGYSTMEIMKKCNDALERRCEPLITATNTIRNDILSIENRWNVVVEPIKIGRNIRYRYQDPNFSIFNFPLNENEIAQLNQAVSLLKRFEGMPGFDWVDELIVSDTRNGEASCTGTTATTKSMPGIIDSQDDLKQAFPDAGDDWSAWPELKSEPAPLDTDQDGMPDEWEDANGLDKNNAEDGAAVGEDGYTNLERYMNSLVAHITEAQNEGGVLLSGNEEFTTGINDVMVTRKPTGKTYNLQGMEVKGDLQKGIYIRDGKKFVVK